MPTLAELQAEQEQNVVTPPTFAQLSQEGGEVPEEKPSEKDKVGTGEYLWNRAKMGFSSLLAFPGLPVDMVHDLTYAVGDLLGFDTSGYQPAKYGAKAIRAAAEPAFGVEEMEAPSKAAQYAGGVTEFAAGSVVPGAAAVASMPTKVGKITAAGAEVASTILGGLGTELDKDLETGPLFGLAGAVLPYSSSVVLNESLGRLRRVASKDFQKEVGKAKAASVLQDELAKFQDSYTNLQQTKYLEENIPGFSPSLGRATGSPGIISLEKRFAEESSEGLARALESERKSISAVNAKLAQDFPNAGYDLTNAPRTHLAVLRTKLKKEQIGIEKRIGELEDTIKFYPSEEIGSSLRALREERRVVVKAQKDAKYEEFYRAADDASLKVDTAPLLGEAKSILNSAGNEFQKKSPVVQEILNKFTPNMGQPSSILSSKDLPIPSADMAPTRADIRTFHSLYRRVNAEIRGFEKAGDYSSAYQLGKLRSRMEGVLEGFKKDGYGEVAKKLKEADTFWLNEYQTVFRKGVGGRIGGYSKYGDITPDEKIVKDIVLGRSNGIDQFFKLYGDNHNAQILLENGIMDAYARTSMRDGKFSPVSAANFLKRYDEQLSKMPSLKATLTDKKLAYQALSNRNAQLNTQIKALNRSKLAGLVGSRDTDALIRKGLSSTQNTAVLRNTVNKSGGDKGLDSLRGTVAEYVLRQNDPFKYFTDNFDKMKIIYRDSKHLKDLHDLAKAKEVLGRATTPRFTETHLVAKDPLEARVGTTFKSMLSQFRAAAQGRVSQEYVMSDIGSKALFTIRQKEFNRMLEEAFYDKEIADDLVKMMASDRPITAKDINKLEKHLFSIGARANITMTQPEYIED